MIQRKKKSFRNRNEEEDLERNEDETNEEYESYMEKPTAGKKAKIIVRNLPFKNLSEDRLRKIFEEYGEIEELKLLKRNGKYIGCGFVQFTKVLSAAKAIHHANGKEITGRRIVVDWAIPKNTYLQKIDDLKKEVEPKEEIKSEPMSDSENELLEFSIDKTPENRFSKKDSESSDEDDENGEDDSDDDDDEDEDDDEESDEKPNIKKENQQIKSNDVEEGKTVFIKNIPFSVNNNELKECVTKYGDVEYAVICIDPLTEHSRGTGFVKFKDKESAAKCIKDSNRLILQDNPLEITQALSKQQLEEKKNQKHVPKDNRNLYLIREGVVAAGSKAAEGVSASDMAKRLQIEQWKNQILKNLNMFVARTRLIIHNLPTKYDDSDLKKLFLKYSNPNAVIKEARVMRDRKNVNLDGVGVSKEVGFVTFTNHEDALTALRNINNNPNIFTDKRRPIVGFSIENKAILNLKQKRVERSKAKLGITIDKKDKSTKLNSKQRRAIRRKMKIIEKRKEAKKLKSEGKIVEKPPVKRKSGEDVGEVSKKKVKLAPKKKVVENVEDNSEYSGIKAEPGKKVKIRSRFKLKTQAAKHRETLKKQRKEKKAKELKKVEKVKDAKQKKGKTNLNDDPQFSKLISRYTEKIMNAPTLKKWYET